MWNVYVIQRQTIIFQMWPAFTFLRLNNISLLSVVILFLFESNEINNTGERDCAPYMDYISLSN